MDVNKKKIIGLSLALIVIIVIGTFFIFKNNKGEKLTNKERAAVKFTENTDLNKETENEAQKENSTNFHYVESFIGEESDIGSGLNKFLIYDGKVAEIENGSKLYIKTLGTDEKIYEIPNNEMIRASGYYIYDDLFWNVKYDTDNDSVVVTSYDKDGKEKKRVALKDFKASIFHHSHNSYIMVGEMRVDSDFIYLLADTNSLPILQIFTKNGELKKVYEHVQSFDVDGKGHYVFSATGSDDFPYEGLFMMDSNSGDEIYRNTKYNPKFIRFSHDKNLIYSLVDDKIKVFDAKDGKYKESVFKFGVDSTYLLDDYSINDFMVGKDDELYYSLMTKNPDINFSDMKNYYYLYNKEEGERPKKETTLIITVPYRSDFLMEAIKRYELKYPEEHIEYDYTYNSYEAFLKNTNEYGEKLALDIISGDIGDIVQTGGSALIYKDLAGTDAFMDLTKAIEKDKNYKELNKEVLNGIKIYDSIRALPINYVFYQYELNKDLEKELDIKVNFNNLSWSEVLDLVKVIEEKAPDKHLFTEYMGGKSVWDVFGTELLVANMPDLIDLENKKVDLNQEWFKELLIKFKDCSKSKNFVLTNPEFDRFDELHGSLLAFTSNRSEHYNDQIAYYDEYNKTHNGRMVPIFTGEKHANRTAYSANMFSINNRSDRKENAWKFLSFLLEEDIQFLASCTGMPVNEKGVARMIKGAINNTVRPSENVDKFNKAMIENSHKIDYLYGMDYLVLDIYEPVESFMNDEITLEEALKKAEKNVIIRLNE